MYYKQGWQSCQKIRTIRILLRFFCIADSDSNFNNIKIYLEWQQQISTNNKTFYLHKITFINNLMDSRFYCIFFALRIQSPILITLIFEFQNRKIYFEWQQQISTNAKHFTSIKWSLHFTYILKFKCLCWEKNWKSESGTEIADSW